MAAKVINRGDRLVLRPRSPAAQVDAREEPSLLASDGRRVKVEAGPKNKGLARLRSKRRGRDPEPEVDVALLTMKVKLRDEAEAELRHQHGCRIPASARRDAAEEVRRLLAKWQADRDLQ